MDRNVNEQHTIAKNSIHNTWKQTIQRRGTRVIIGFLFLVNGLVGNLTSQAAEPIYPLEQLGCDTCNEYQLDFLYLVKLLQDSHPNVYANFPEEEFEQEQARMLEELKTLDDVSTFALLLQQFCARISDAHTKIKYYEVIQGSQLIFPVGFTVLHDDFYLTDFDTYVDMKFLGAKVIAVNGIPMQQMVQQLGSLASCENDICRKQEMRYLLQEPKILQSMGIIGDNERLTLTVTTRDEAEQTLTRPGRAGKAVEWAAINIKDHPVTAKKGAEFFYRILSEHQLCYFQFNKFRDRQVLKRRKQMMGVEQFTQRYRVDPDTFPDFRDFLHMMFAEIQQKQISSLIVDLRYNGGGNSTLGRQIMYYLQEVSDVLKGYVIERKVSPLLWYHQSPDAFEEKKTAG